jgi:hypothetical protein
MVKYLVFFAFQILVFASCNIGGIEKKKVESSERDFDSLHYVYHFYKSELDNSHAVPSEYKPKSFDISGRISAKIYSGDTLIRFVYRSKGEKGHVDSTIELFRQSKLSSKEFAMIPSTLLGCKLLGAYHSSKEDIPDNFYYCFYSNDRKNLLNVVHLYKLGNVSAAFYYTNEDVDPMTKYKDDMAQLLFINRSLNLSDSITVKVH